MLEEIVDNDILGRRIPNVHLYTVSEISLWQNLANWNHFWRN